MKGVCDPEDLFICIRTKLEEATMDGFHRTLANFKKNTAREPYCCFCNVTDYGLISEDTERVFRSSSLGYINQTNPQEPLPPPGLHFLGIHLIVLDRCRPGTVLFGLFDYRLGIILREI